MGIQWRRLGTAKQKINVPWQKIYIEIRLVYRWYVLNDDLYSMDITAVTVCKNFKV